MNNVRSTVTCNDISDFVKGLNVRVISCFETKSRFKNARAFRLCINAEDRKVFNDINNWPHGIVIRDWKFNKPQISSVPEQSVTTDANPAGPLQANFASANLSAVDSHDILNKDVLSLAR